MKKIVLGSLVASSLLMSAGYKIPETSTNSVALSGANIAHTSSADAAYDNPANMVFMDDKNHMEANLMYVGTSATEYTATGSTSSINADEQQFLLPSFHYVSPKLGESGTRVGLSIVVPGGLSRTWKDSPAILRAKEFTLEVVEINPTVAFQVSNTVSVAFGFRAVHSSGIVKFVPVPNVASVDMSGSSLDFGYNLALAYHPNEDWQIGLTYRSNVNLSEVGTADIVHPNPAIAGSYDASVSIPLPATFNAAIAYTLPSKTTIEFVYEKTYWSAYSNLDFEYTNPVIEAVFGTAIPKNWEDTNAYRVGVTQELDALTLMAGYVYDQTAIPDNTLGFESPGSNAQSVSLGARFKVDENLDVGLSALYSMKEDRTIDAAAANINGINGTFSNSNVLLVSAGVGYRF
ncbi:MAG: outer membrane protein transport protein [Campylobacterales bacterium]|nr:outer membrane protein transport protein [Campylobacterales bacterium]